MQYIEFENIFKKECIKNNINIKEEKIKLFYDYMKYLLNWNEKINLTAIKEEKEFIVKHFVDSLSISEIVGDNKRIIDVGTGGGFPGIPLKLLNENLNVSLVDSVNKKIMVLNDIINKMKLNNIEAIHTRAEDLAKKKEYREGFDIAVSRAVSNMNTLVEYLLPFVKIGGYVVCMKGPGYEEELNASKTAIEILGGKIEEIKELKVSDELDRNIIIIKKIKSTSSKYPRGQGKPLREPLK